MPTTMTTIENRNGVELREIKSTATERVLCYELYIDGEWINRFSNLKTAKSMWKDFSAC